MPTVDMCDAISGFLALLLSDGLRKLSKSAEHAEFSNTGLKVNSNIRATRLATIERKLITWRLGRLRTGYLQQLNVAMIQAFQL